ncbi:MAG TPA: DUF4026 domain-containing protein [Phycisphaerae bacterium]|nr:DUF4026 domain-containing protein [Phycisphaerae bacterium]HRW55758.1 DUF4026 domain-containing protein [Phycisphaerae bacterium]
MGWFNKSIDCIGGVFFRGRAVPRPQEFAFLKQHGMNVGLVKGSTHADWEIRVRHPQWGNAEIRPEKTRLAPLMIDHDWSLLEGEKEEARAAGVGVRVKISATRANLLADRKNLLRFLRAIMGDDGVMAMDLMAYRLWSRDSLDDEVAHDADLDISQIFAIHAVQADNGGPVRWFHTHGLGEIGFFDFDILHPDESVVSGGGDLSRSIAFAIAEEAVTLQTADIKLIHPNGHLAFCPVDKFHKSAPASETRVRDADEYHMERRAVIVEPTRGFFGRFRRRPRINQFLTRPLPANPVIAFTGDATNLMASRARNTYGVFRRIWEDLAELELPMIVKLGYPVDNGADDEREHLWFQVHAAKEATIDATLANTPYNVSGMKEGDRSEHSVELITDWTVMSPIGNINPRQQHVYRLIREKKDRLKAMMAHMRATRGDA